MAYTRWRLCCYIFEQQHFLVCRALLISSVSFCFWICVSHRFSQKAHPDWRRIFWIWSLACKADAWMNRERRCRVCPVWITQTRIFCAGYLRSQPTRIPPPCPMRTSSKCWCGVRYRIAPIRRLLSSPLWSWSVACSFHVCSFFFIGEKSWQGV